MYRMLFLYGALLLGFEVFGQNTRAAQNILEDWYGQLEVMGQKLNIKFDINKEDEEYSALMEVPQQSDESFPVKDVKVKNDTLQLNMPMLNAAYKGKWSKEKEEVSGVFKQNGKELDLKLTRVPFEKSKRPQEPEAPFSYHAEEVEFHNKKDDLHLAGTLTLPKKGQRFPAVILITGSGAHNRDEEIFQHKPFMVIADYLTQHGIAVLRYDDRGVGKSGGKFSGSGIKDFSTDVEAAFDYLQTREEIDSDKIGLVGHSEGGVLAPMVAARNKDVAFLVLLAGTGVDGGEVLLKQLELMGASLGMDEETLKLQKKTNARAYDLLRQNKDSADTAEQLKAYVAEVEGKHPELFESEQEIAQYINQLMAMRDLVIHDPAKSLQNTDAPVLALNGAHDWQVDADQNLPAIKKALEKGGNKEITIKKLDSLNHLFQKSETGAVKEYGEIEQTFSPKALALIKDWVLNQVE